MDAKLLRLASPAIAYSLTHIFNLSICQGVLPADWKTARVTPIFKNKGDKSDPNNYRPISVIPIVAKILEKAVKLQLVTHFVTNDLFTQSQSAYLKLHSTQTALHQLIDKCIENIDKGLTNLLCCLDLSKGFDCLNHDILLYKMAKYSISKHCMVWFSSYLTDRTQIVNLGTTSSSVNNITIGVPQGTVLGPILFLIYVNDLSNQLTDATVITYADDNNIICAGKSTSDIVALMETTLYKANVWFKSNRLTVNTNKSCIIPITTRSRLNTLFENLEIKLNGSKLDICTNTKVLGVHIDQTLSFKNHIDQLTKRVSPKIAVIHRLRPILSSDILNIIYQTTVQPIFDYCLSVWGTFSKQNINNTQKLQNRAVRAVTGNFDYKSSVSSMIKQQNWMNIKERTEYFTAILMYKCLNDLAPTYLSNKFNFVSDAHPYSTRSTTNNKLALPKPNSELLKKSFYYNGSRIWNELPSNICNAESLGKFKHLYKTTIL